MSIVITASSMITSVGRNVEESFKAMCDGNSGLKSFVNITPSKFNVNKAYEIDTNIFNHKNQASYMIEQVLKDVIKDMGSLKGKKVSIIIGTGLREMKRLELWRKGQDEFPISDSFFTPMINSITEIDSIYTISNACASSLYALALGEDLITLGEADIVIVAGCDLISESMFGLLDRSNPVKPEKLQPFDLNRKGVLLGEGAAAIVLEKKCSAYERGQQPLAALRAVGISCDAFHETAPDKNGMVNAINNAHQRAGVSPNQVNLIYAHGTGTYLNDQTEIQALIEVFGDKLEYIPITGIKSIIGHTSGASGLIALITAIESINRCTIPATLYLEELMDEARDLNIVSEVTRENSSLNIVQINAFGFGGLNAVAIIERI